MLANKLIIYGFSAFAGIISSLGITSIFKDKIDLAEENKGLKMELSVYRESYIEQGKKIDSLAKVKCYTKEDTSIAYVHGYNYAIDNRACDYKIKTKLHTVYVGNGKGEIFCRKEVTTSELKTISEVGEIEDASIHKK